MSVLDFKSVVRRQIFRGTVLLIFEMKIVEPVPHFFSQKESAI